MLFFLFLWAMASANIWIKSIDRPCYRPFQERGPVLCYPNATEKIVSMCPCVEGERISSSQQQPPQTSTAIASTSAPPPIEIRPKCHAMEGSQQQPPQTSTAIASTSAPPPIEIRPKCHAMEGSFPMPEHWIVFGLMSAALIFNMGLILGLILA